MTGTGTRASRTTSRYHAATQGQLVCELVRRTAGKTLAQFVTEDTARPLGADFQIGAHEQDWERIAAVVPPRVSTSPKIPDPSKVRRRTFLGPLIDAESANTTPWRRAELGALNGHGNARSGATILSALSLGGTVDGVRLLGRDAVALAFEEQSNGIDLALGVPLRFGIGFVLPQLETVPYIHDEKIRCRGGWGGPLIVMHPESGMTFSYMMNRMGERIIGSDRAEHYRGRLRRAGRKLMRRNSTSREEQEETR